MFHLQIKLVQINSLELGTPTGWCHSLSFLHLKWDSLPHENLFVQSSIAICLMPYYKDYLKSLSVSSLCIGNYYSFLEYLQFSGNPVIIINAFYSPMNNIHILEVQHSFDFEIIVSIMDSSVNIIFSHCNIKSFLSKILQTNK